jgi:hypothetical protein
VQRALLLLLLLLLLTQLRLLLLLLSLLRHFDWRVVPRSADWRQSYMQNVLNTCCCCRRDLGMPHFS